MKRRPFSLLLAAPMVVALGGCQTVEQAATARVVEVCTIGGYGPASPNHGWCINYLKPVAVRDEQARRQQQVEKGLALMAKGLNPPPPAKLTCVQEGAVTRCY